MINVIFITTFVLAWMLKYLNYITYYYTLILLFVFIYGFFYLPTKQNPRKFLVYALSSTIIILTVWILEYTKVIHLSLYDGLLFVLSIYIAGTIFSEKRDDAITITLSLILLLVVVLYFPNISLGDTYYPNINSQLSKINNKIEGMPFLQRVKEGYNTLMDYFNVSMSSSLYPINQSTESDKNKIRKNIKKSLDDAIRIELSPKEISQPGPSNAIISLSISNLLSQKEIKNVFVGVDTGLNGKKYGINVSNSDGNCNTYNTNCYKEISSLSPGAYDVSLFDISLPSCNVKTYGQVYTRYVSTAIARKIFFIDKGEYDKTISSDGPLTVDIELLPSKLSYEEGKDMKFIINFYSFVNSQEFKDPHIFHKYVFLSLPSEIYLNYDSNYCPYRIYKEDDDKTIYLFEVRTDAQCFGKEKIGTLSCKAIVPKENVKDFVEKYQTFEAYVPYVFYGRIPYPISSSSSEECKNQFHSNTFGLSNVVFTHKRDYLISFEKTYSEGMNINSLINDIAEFCKQNFEGSFQDYGCAYIVIKNYKSQESIQDTSKKMNAQKNEEDLNKNTPLDKLLASLQKNYLKNEESSIKIINKYDGKGDLIIDAQYKFNCVGGQIEITLK